jgi:hypothetical protein
MKVKSGTAALFSAAGQGAREASSSIAASDKDSVVPRCESDAPWLLNKFTGAS